ncbi:MAG: hypothetical protein MUF03_07445 [Rubrivivax sp.]|jgi:uncharacterized membrane protein|nr:hypothetical protein [Rubrivivax sp.]
MWVATDIALAAAALAAALAARPWRALPEGGPPWPWLAWWALLPLLWGLDGVIAMPAAAQALSGASLLVLMAGWPLAVLAMLPLLAVLGAAAGLGWDEALHRMVWLGVVPATLAFALGAAIRRWMPNHLFVYILGRGFFATAAAGTAAGALSAALHGAPDGVAIADLMLGRGLAAWGDAWIAGMVTAIFVAFRPQWLATYADRIYLPPRPDARPASAARPPGADPE